MTYSTLHDQSRFLSLSKERKPFMAFSGSGLLLAYFHGIASWLGPSGPWLQPTSMTPAARWPTSATISLLTTWSSRESVEVRRWHKIWIVGASEVRILKRRNTMLDWDTLHWELSNVRDWKSLARYFLPEIQSEVAQLYWHWPWELICTRSSCCSTPKWWL